MIPGHVNHCHEQLTDADMRDVSADCPKPSLFDVAHG
jgi:hypothetical protein